MIPSGGKKTWWPSWIKGAMAAPADFEGAAVVISNQILFGQTNTIYPDPNDNGASDPKNGANGDPDGDGDTTLAEYASGTSPIERPCSPALQQRASPKELVVGRVHFMHL